MIMVSNANLLKGMTKTMSKRTDAGADKKNRPATFKMPKTIRHKEARTLINNLVRDLNERGMFSDCDIPNLHRMATAYDMYLDCVDVVSKMGPTSTNVKGETVKRPEINILRESWTQYLELAKEYGLTTKSRGQIKALSTKDDEKCVLDDLIEMR